MKLGIRLLISPLDVLMFRESKSFNAGENFIAKSTYPSPQAVVGAIRAKLFKKYNNQQIKEFIGYNKEEPNFEVYGIFFRKGESEIFPLPSNIVKYKKDGDEEIFEIFPRKIKWRNLDKTISAGKYMHYKKERGFIDWKTLERYLRGEAKVRGSEIIKEKYVVKREERVGIKLTDGKTVEESLFYTSQFLRFESDVGLSVWLDENLKDYLGESGLLKLGGESRGAHYQAADGFEIELEDIVEKINNEKRFIIYFATPAVIEDQNNRCTWNIKEIVENKLGIRVTFICGIVDKPQIISGWDMAKKKPKPVRYAIPAGSVYFIEFSDGHIDKPYIKLGSLSRLGFGLGFIGLWKKRGDANV